MSKIDPQKSEQYFQDAMQEAADSMALEGYTITPEIQKMAEERARRNKASVFKQLDELRDKCFPKKDSIT